MTVFTSRWLDWKVEDSQTPYRGADKTDKRASVSSVGSLVGGSGKMREARTAWNEAREWSRRSAAFRWASSTTPAGCWTWASAHRPNLWVELDAAFDAIAAAVGEADPYALALALVRFRGVILSASGAYSREQATEAKTTPGSGGAPC